ncbi:MAG: transcriptional regulator [Bacteroidota bacterium]|nr:transcriptional regulator [Bacteroidota bacterium]
MKKVIIFSITTILCFEILSGQNSIGLSETVNYSKLVYGAGAQNWDIKQDSKGIMYFANSEGLLTFDGSFWKLYPIPNKTVVRSLDIIKDRIYVGAQNEMGFFTPDKKGNLAYTSLLPLLPLNERSFADVWKMVSIGDDIFFQTNTKIMQLNGNSFTIYHDEDWKFIGKRGNNIIVQDHNYQLFQLQNHSLSPVADQSSLPKDFLITSSLSYNNDTTLITTFKYGIYLLSGTSLTKLKTPVLDLIATKSIYKSILVDKSQILLATSLGGCFVVDKKGNLIQSFSLTEGLQNNNVRQAYLDKNRNIWLALDNGIDFLAYDNAIKHIFTDRQNEGGGYAAIIHKNVLYLGTSNGLYFTPLDSSKNISLVKGFFKPVLKTQGQVWNLSEVYGQLLMGHHEGSFTINNNEAFVIDKRFGFWNFFPLDKHPGAAMIAGTYHGISFYNYNNGNFSNDSNAVNFESARIVAIHGQDIWIAHPYKGIFKINYKRSQPTIRSYAGRGLTSVNHYYIYAIRNKIIAPTEGGFYEYNSGKDEFVPSTFFEKIFGSTRVNYMKEDTEGNIWFTSEKKLGVVEFNGSAAKIIYLPELNGKMVSGFDFIYPIDVNNVLVGGEKGFYNINYQQYRNSNNEIEVLMRKVKPIDEPNSVIFGGTYGSDTKTNYTKNTVPELPYKWNSLHFEFSAILYAQQSNIEYDYKLEAFDKNWSGWTKKTEKDYTNLPPGNYTFLVKARNNLGNESSPTKYSFAILPPWYRSLLAYLVYALMGAALMLYLYRRQKIKFVKQRLKYEEEQRRLHYLHQLEIDRNEKTIVKLKNEKLEAEINHKNKELAATTMHLVQKGELMGKIREELVRSLRNAHNETPKNDFKKVMRMMSEDIRVDEDWSQFTLHFDQVHGDFLMSLKEKFPNLTNSELKLCAYLRMNLSTKEMAQLMNISVRGVEVSRYRLRKKLLIPSDANLSDYLIESIKR